MNADERGWHQRKYLSEVAPTLLPSFDETQRRDELGRLYVILIYAATVVIMMLVSPIVTDEKMYHMIAGAIGMAVFGTISCLILEWAMPKTAEEKEAWAIIAQMPPCCE